jgi:archaetidylinositol phosphate synthase
MIDSKFRSFWQILLIDRLVKVFAYMNVSPNYLTIAAICFGVLSGFSLFIQQKLLAILALAVSGLLDAADGTLARKSQNPTTAGCILDIFGDRLVETNVVLGLFLYDPINRDFMCLCLLSSFYLCILHSCYLVFFNKITPIKDFIIAQA